MNTLAAMGLFGCTALALVPLGCAHEIEYAPLRSRPLQQGPEGPQVPESTADMLRQCVDASVDDLGEQRYKFRYTVKVAEEDGHIIDVTAHDVPNENLAACTRTALREMVVPEDVLKLRPSELLSDANRPAVTVRTLQGTVVVVLGVSIALGELIINAGGVTVCFAIALEIVKDVAETLRKKKRWEKECQEHLNNCLMADLADERGNNWNERRCATCFRRCKKEEKWPKEIPLDDGDVSCEYWKPKWQR